MIVTVFLNLPSGEVLHHEIGPDTRVSNVLKHIDMTRLTHLTFEGEELDNNSIILKETAVTSDCHLYVVTELFVYKGITYPLPIKEFGKYEDNLPEFPINDYGCSIYDYNSDHGKAVRTYWSTFDDDSFKRIIRLQLKHECNDYFKYFEYDIDKFVIYVKILIEFKSKLLGIDSYIHDFISHECDCCNVCLKIKGLGSLLAQNNKLIKPCILFFNPFVKYRKAWLIKSLYDDGVDFMDQDDGSGYFDNLGSWYSHSIYCAIDIGDIKLFELLSSINDKTKDSFRNSAYRRHLSEELVRISVAFRHKQHDMTKHLIEKYNVSDNITLHDVFVDDIPLQLFQKVDLETMLFQNQIINKKIGAFDRLKTIFEFLEREYN